MDAFYICCLAWCGASDIRKRIVSNRSIILLPCLGLTHMGCILLYGGVWWQYLAGLLLSIPFFIVLLEHLWFKRRPLKNRIPLAPVISIGAAGAIALGYLLRLANR